METKFKKCVELGFIKNGIYNTNYQVTFYNKELNNILKYIIFN